MCKYSEHINAMSFFVVEKMAKNQDIIVYYQIEDTITNLSSKPAQGSNLEFQRSTTQGTKKEYFHAHE